MRKTPWTAPPFWKTVEQALEKGDKEGALKALRQITYPSPLHAWALLETSRFLYEEARWKEFFGATYYLRQVYPNSIEAETSRLLESLALLRHCRWEDTAKVLNEKKLTVTENAQNQSFLQEVLTVVSKVGNETLVKKEKSKVLMPASSLWPIASKSMIRLDSYRIRRDLPSLCKEPQAEAK